MVTAQRVAQGLNHGFLANDFVPQLRTPLAIESLGGHRNLSDEEDSELCRVYQTGSLRARPESAWHAIIKYRSGYSRAHACPGCLEKGGIPCWDSAHPNC